MNRSLLTRDCIHIRPIFGGYYRDAQWADEVLLPHKPSATNDLHDGQRPMHRENALTMRYIEHSPYVLLGSIVIDCDHVDTALRAFERPKNQSGSELGGTVAVRPGTHRLVFFVSRPA
ncbi:hypothetical protein [Nocardia speluncae]|uniref:hypothetical protein n=1 Tax=Nocardia speluncae TaxID=419477 RepID=UPI00082F9CEA|nr:hypothetical protein [Nocardia speluncae]